MKSPKSITLVEANPASVNRYSIYALQNGTTTPILASRDYAISGGTTVCPIGSDGFLASISDGTNIDLHVIERAGAGSSADDTDQLAPGGPYTVHTLPDGVETITVQV